MSAIGTVLAVVSTSSGAGAAGIGTDQTTIRQLEDRIASQGARVQLLVSRYNQIASHMNQIEGQIASDQKSLIRERRAQSQATIQLRHWAIDTYVSAVSGNSSTLPTLTGSADAQTLPEQEVYIGVASGSLNTAVAALQIAEQRTTATQRALQSEQTQTAITLQQYASAGQAAQAALGADEATLSAVNGNLLTLVNAANEQRQAAAEQQAEQSLAAAATLQTPPPQASPTPVPVTPTHILPGNYANPLRGINGLSPFRIDQGVDFGGFGPIFAIGDGVVLSTVVGGWPGGTFISYRLTDGPAAGYVVYAAEDIDPMVRIGQTLTSDTVIGQMYEGSSGIETGWADSRGDGTTMASDAGQFYGSNTTAYGYNFSQFLQSLGSPGGIVQNNPPTGNLPPGWPHW